MLIIYIIRHWVVSPISQGPRMLGKAFTSAGCTGQHNPEIDTDGHLPLNAIPADTDSDTVQTLTHKMTTRTRACGYTIARQTGNNSVSECQNPRQLDIKQDRACPTPIGAFLQYRERRRGCPDPRRRPANRIQPVASRTQPEACSKERADGSVRAAFTLWGKTQHLTSLCPVPLQPPEECGTLSIDLVFGFQ